MLCNNGFYSKVIYDNGERDGVCLVVPYSSRCMERLVSRCTEDADNFFVGDESSLGEAVNDFSDFGVYFSVVNDEQEIV